MASAGLQIRFGAVPGDPNAGITALQQNLVPRAIRDANDQIGRDLQRMLVQESRKRNKTGRFYNVRVRGRKRRHRASAPDEVYANLTGRTSAGADYRTRGNTDLEFGISGSAFYAPFVEFGTQNGKIKARNSLLITINKQQGNAFNYYADLIQEQLFNMYNPAG